MRGSLKNRFVKCDRSSFRMNFHLFRSGGWHISRLEDLVDLLQGLERCHAKGYDIPLDLVDACEKWLGANDVEMDTDHLTCILPAIATLKSSLGLEARVLMERQIARHAANIPRNLVCTTLWGALGLGLNPYSLSLQLLFVRVARLETADANDHHLLNLIHSFLRIKQHDMDVDDPPFPQPCVDFMAYVERCVPWTTPTEPLPAFALPMLRQLQVPYETQVPLFPFCVDAAVPLQLAQVYNHLRKAKNADTWEEALPATSVTENYGVAAAFVFDRPGRYPSAIYERFMDQVCGRMGVKVIRVQEGENLSAALAGA
eukprot:GEMP01034483.1.p1 GENE.GEMP01034483.1~~GEMP01034483.1.p1  ORF type:complete len:315 (+),score=58.86 GEMP01034483.1:369-1313(+)